MPSSDFCEHLKNVVNSGTRRYTKKPHGNGSITHTATQRQVGKNNPGRQREEEAQGPSSRSAPSTETGLRNQRRIEDKFGEVTWGKPF